MKRIIIIGGGPAGLTAAYELSKHTDKYNVVVLEESNTLGGISKTVNHAGNRMDIGGHRFFTKDEEIMRFWLDMMPLQGKPAYDDKVLNRDKPYDKNGPDPEAFDEVILIRDRISRIYFNKTFFDYPIKMNASTIRGMGFFKTIRAGFSYLAACIHKRKETNLENFYINRFGKVLYKMFFEGYTTKLWGMHPSKISADWGVQRIRGLSVRAVLRDIFGKLFHKKNRHVETSLIENFYYPKYGPGQLWELVGKRIERSGGIIRLRHRVKEINTKDGHITSVLCDTGRGDILIDGDIFLTSMPIRDLITSIKGDNRPSKDVYKIATKLPYRDFMTVGLLVDRLKLKNKTEHKTLGDIVPDCWIYVQDTKVRLGRIQIFNNWSPYMVADPDKSVWIGLEYFCNEGDELWSMSDDEFCKLATGELVKMGIIEGSSVLDSHVERVKKAYPAYYGAYKHINRLTGYMDSIPNLYAIGRNGQHRYNNMDHSMATALEAVRLIESGSSDKRKLWSVNTEAEYHEEKKTD